MQEKTVTIKNKAGIHCRPSSTIIMAAGQFAGNDFTVESANGTSKLQSILDLLSLGLQLGDTVTVKVSGPDEVNACEKISSLFETEFDFPPL